jgi:hypothetical protein
MSIPAVMRVIRKTGPAVVRVVRSGPNATLPQLLGVARPQSLLA